MQSSHSNTPAAASSAPSAAASTVVERLQQVRADIAAEAQQAGRSGAEVRLIAVSKRQPITAIAAALSAGQIDFGENYLQEALPKIEALSAEQACWHYIGRIQSNKTQQIAAAFQWVHTVDRGKIAERLSASRRSLPQLDPLNLCLQVNIDQDAQKAGVSLEELPALAGLAADLPAVRCRGLMTILDPESDPALSFARLQAVFEEHRATFGWDTLSMGMSQDYPAAIRHGATCIRVGTAIFGARPAVGGSA